MQTLKNNVLEIINHHYLMEKKNRNAQNIPTYIPYQGLSLQEIFSLSELRFRYNENSFKQAIQHLLDENKIKVTLPNTINPSYILSE